MWWSFVDPAVASRPGDNRFGGPIYESGDVVPWYNGKADVCDALRIPHNLDAGARGAPLRGDLTRLQTGGGHGLAKVEWFEEGGGRGIHVDKMSCGEPRHWQKKAALDWRRTMFPNEEHERSEPPRVTVRVQNGRRGVRDVHGRVVKYNRGNRGRRGGRRGGHREGRDDGASRAPVRGHRVRAGPKFDREAYRREMFGWRDTVAQAGAGAGSGGGADAVGEGAAAADAPNEDHVGVRGQRPVPAWQSQQAGALAEGDENATGALGAPNDEEMVAVPEEESDAPPPAPEPMETTAQGGTNAAPSTDGRDIAEEAPNASNNEVVGSSGGVDTTNTATHAEAPVPASDVVQAPPGENGASDAPVEHRGASEDAPMSDVVAEGGDVESTVGVGSTGAPSGSSGGTNEVNDRVHRRLLLCQRGLSAHARLAEWRQGGLLDELVAELSLDDEGPLTEDEIAGASA